MKQGLSALLLRNSEEHMSEEDKNKNHEKKGDAPVFFRALKDIRIACWRNKKEDGREWFHTQICRTWRKGDEINEAPGSLNGVADIALAIAGLESAKRFIDRLTTD
jgi:hypothetical protein